MSTVLGALLLRFMTDYLGIAAALAGLLIGISKIYDAAADPLIGWLSDRVGSPIGRRRPFLLAGVILCPVAIVSLFLVPPLPNQGWTCLYMLCALILFATAFTVWQVPYLAMAAEMTRDYHERSRLFGFRLYGGAFGQLLGALAGPWFLIWLGGDRNAYGSMAFLLGALILASNLVCFRQTRSATFRVREAPRHIRRATLASMVRNQALNVLLIAKSATYFGAGASASTFAFYAKYYLRVGDGWIGGYFILLTVGIIATVPLWVRAGRRSDKKYVAIAAAILWVATALSWLLSSPGEAGWAIAARIVLTGAGIGGYTLFGQSMFVDVIEDDYRRAGLRREGAFMGLLNLVEKAFTAFGLTAAGGVLAAAGYVASANGPHAVQTPQVVSAISLLFPLTAAIGGAFSVLALCFYNLSQERLNQTV